MQWEIIITDTGKKVVERIFEDRDIACSYLSSMGGSFQNICSVVPDTKDCKLYRMLTEGLVASDLRHIVLPQISIDEYVPGDPNTDNVVIAFFIKGVPEAVIPVRDFIMKCKGILDVAYGDSDTIPNTSIVYAEMSRKQFRFSDLRSLMEQIGLLTDLDTEDFSVLFPSSDKRHPYSEEAIMGYFNARSSKQNWEAQKAAIQSADDDQETTGASRDESDNISREEQTEAMIEHLAESFGR